MSLNHFLENTFHLMRNIPEHDAGGYWENFMAQYDNFRLHQPHKTHHLGLPNNIQLEQTPIVFQEWLNSNPGVHVFHFVSLKAHQKISHTLSDISEKTHKTLHMLPDTDLNYGRFKEELWDLHLEGYQVFFHYTNEVKTFAKSFKDWRIGVSVSASAPTGVPLGWAMTFKRFVD